MVLTSLPPGTAQHHPLHKLLFEQEGEGILVLQQDGCIIMSNHAAEKIFSSKKAELNGKNITDFFKQGRPHIILSGTGYTTYLATDTNQKQIKVDVRTDSISTKSGSLNLLFLQAKTETNEKKSGKQNLSSRIADRTRMLTNAINELEKNKTKSSAFQTLRNNEAQQTATLEILQILQQLMLLIHDSATHGVNRLHKLVRRANNQIKKIESEIQFIANTHSGLIKHQTEEMELAKELTLHHFKSIKSSGDTKVTATRNFLTKAIFYSCVHLNGKPQDMCADISDHTHGVKISIYRNFTRSAGEYAEQICGLRQISTPGLYMALKYTELLQGELKIDEDQHLGKVINIILPSK